MVSKVVGNGNPNNAGTLRPEDIALLRSATDAARLRMTRRTYPTPPPARPMAPIVRAVVQRILAKGRRRRLRGAA